MIPAELLRRYKAYTPEQLGPTVFSYKKLSPVFVIEKGLTTEIRGIAL
jgi:hypothetical protein